MKNIYKLLLAGFIFRLILSFITWHPDVTNHIDWGIRFWQYGPAKFYTANVWSFTWPNQPPGTMYIFAGIRKLYEALFGLFGYLHFDLHIFPGRTLLFFESNLYPALLKLPAILGDIGIACLIYLTINRLTAGHSKKAALFGALLFLINPVIWYNSSLWGQTDSIINFFAFLAFFLLLEKKLVLSLLFLVLSFYIKASLLIFLPIFAIIAIRQKYEFKKWLLAIAASLLVVGLLTLPFSVGEPFGWLFALYKDKVFTQQLQVITANAFNLWAAVAGIHERPQSLLLGPLSYQVWGIVLFALSYLPTLYLVFRRQDAKSVFWVLAIASFSSFMLLTNMHERYLYPLFPYLTILVATGVIGNWYYWITSIIGLLNLYNFWWFPKVDLLVNFLSFNDRLMPRVLGMINFGLLAYLYFYLAKSLKAKN